MSDELSDYIAKHPSETKITGRVVPRIEEGFLPKCYKEISVKQIDLINKPPHYTFGKFEVIDVILDWFPNNPLLFTVVKYCARAEHKDRYLEDLKKARFYLNKAIELAENKK